MNPVDMLPWLGESEAVLTGLAVDNLRALRMDEPIQLRRLMLIVGRNGIGKSTLARLLPLLGQSARHRGREPILWWDREGVDFGSFGDALRRGADEVRLTFELADNRLPPWRVSSSLVRSGDGCRVGSVEYGRGSDRARFTFDDQQQVVRVAGTIRGTPFSTTGADGSRLGRVDPSALFAFMRSRQDIRMQRRLFMPEVPLSRQALLPEASLQLARFNRLVLPDLTERTAYLGPFRAIPERTYRPQSVSVEQLDPRGANLAMFITALDESERADLNDFLRDGLGFAVHTRPSGGHHELLIEVEGQRYNLLDVGFGYSQVLPVAVQLWAGGRVLSSSRIKRPLAAIVVEQPELHLHPHHQVLVARAMAASAMSAGGPMQLIETHSDHLVSEIGLLVARGELDAERVGVVCVEPHPDGDGAAVRLATFDEDGVLQNWPAGFLAP